MFLIFAEELSSFDLLCQLRIQLVRILAQGLEQVLLSELLSFFSEFLCFPCRRLYPKE